MKTNNQKISDFKNISIFQGLNSLRFIAAFLVVMHHSETIKRKNGIENFEWLGLFRNGGNAVTFFFVLSGFLITYLLLKERGKIGDVKVKNFYLKRILRIWPLYFLLVFIGTIGLPFILPLLNVTYEMPYTFGQSWFYFVFFLPGLVTFFFGHHFLEPLWSIGVEEVFYLLWAPLFKISKSRIFILLFIVILFKTLLSLIGIYYLPNELFNYIINTFQFEAMAIGGLGAYFIYTKGLSLSQLVIFKIPFQIILILLILSYLIFHSNIDNVFWNTLFKIPILSPLLIDSLFLYLIICVSVVDNSIIKLRYKTLSFLGEISYGIYMYHMLVIFTTIYFLKKYLIQMNSLLGLIVFYTVTAIFTIIVSSLSKYFFENYFLNLKSRLDRNVRSIVADV
jgi:peptidoglycan/LPS O-acetylase OafA/YrhL